jgi:thymidine phosphorylase
MLQRAIASGDAARTAEKMIEAQGGDPRVVADRSRLAVAGVEVVVSAAAGGFVTRIDALEIGLAGVGMGAGRTRADQSVDTAVGILLEKKPGDAVTAGEPLARLYVRQKGDEGRTGIVDRVRGAFTISQDPVGPSRPLVLDRIAS